MKNKTPYLNVNFIVFVEKGAVSDQKSVQVKQPVIKKCN